MLKKSLTLSVFVAAILVLPLSAGAQSVNLQDALARMNSIIAEMEKLRAEFTTIASTVGQTATTPAPTPTVLGVQSSAVFTQPLVFGETNDDIKRIQKLLATDPEIYPYGVASGFFGPKTEEAMKNLQARNGWDTPGVVGPATKDLLERYFKAYPDENWPADVLKSAPPAAAPAVLGASASVEDQLKLAMQALAQTQAQQSTGTSGSNLAKEINVTFDDGEALIEIIYKNGNRKGLVADTDDEDEVVDYIVGHTPLTEAMVSEVIDFGSKKRSSSGDEEEASDALDEADEAIDDADDEIDAADEDGDDIDWADDTLRDAKRLLKDAEKAFEDEDYDEAIDLAKDAKAMAKKAEDRIDEEKGSGSGDNEDIDEINVEVGDGESEVVVEYDDGDEYEFTVDEDKESSIIEAIADELDMDEDDVEDLVDFDYGDVDRISARVDEDEGETLVRVFYESGAEQRLRLDIIDEDDIIDEVADELDMDTEDVEDLIEFD